MNAPPTFDGTGTTRGAAVAEASGFRGTDADLGADLPPQQLIFTLFGLYSRDQGGWLSSAAVVRLATALGVEEALARSAVSRMKRRDYVQSLRRDGQAGYELTERSVRIVLDGDERVFRRARALPEDHWVVVGFSVPESRREQRHQLRTALVRLGFGTVSPGMWIAPGHLEEEALGALQQLDVTEYLDVFRADYVAFGDPRAKVAAWWDLELFASMYARFIERFGSAEPADGAEVDPAAALRDYVCALTVWKRLPYLDPGLPLDLLPVPWPGSVAEGLFLRLHERLSEPAKEYAATLL